VVCGTSRHSSLFHAEGHPCQRARSSSTGRSRCGAQYVEVEARSSTDHGRVLAIIDPFITFAKRTPYRRERCPASSRKNMSQIARELTQTSNMLRHGRPSRVCSWATRRLSCLHPGLSSLVHLQKYFSNIFVLVVVSIWVMIPRTRYTYFRFQHSISHHIESNP